MTNIIANQDLVTTLLKKINLTIIKLDNSYLINPHLGLFDKKTQQKILSYYKYTDQLIAFASSLLQKYYLANLAQVVPSQLHIEFTQHHKPYIAKPATINLKFNISHCYNYVVLATYEGADYEIGVDIEMVNNNININEMSSIVFSATEQKLIDNSQYNFFKLWTKKEALIKAMGTGFTTDFYKDTQLNLSTLETQNDYTIITYTLENYFLSVCLRSCGLHVQGDRDSGVYATL
ncbi:MAG: 4'-phosphopantetheinyl transferase superfamily protein [Burkholderiales bacterium]|nr:4'-phosphopantetheinyl transferase superfamily protein [Burkholderiales bacterium]